MAKRRKKRRKGIGLRIILFILMLAIIVALVGVAIYFLCPLKEVTVEGTDLYSDKEISEYILDDEYSVNTIYVYFKNLLFPKDNAEFIDHFEVKPTGLNSINIKAVEKTILGYMTDGEQYIYFDYKGIIQEISPTYVDGYILVVGEIIEDCQIGQTLSIGEDKAGFLVSAIKILSKQDMLPQKIIYDDYGRMTLCYETINICLGNNDYLEEKIDRLQYVLPQIEGMKGTLHLENFSMDNTDIVFEKEEEVSE